MKKPTEDKYERLGAYHWRDYALGHPKFFSNTMEAFYRGHVNYILRDFNSRKKGSVLDVGCGDGLIACVLRWSGWDMEGIDLSKKGIGLARLKCPTVDFGVEDIFKKTGRYDYVLASEIIEHLPNPEEFLQKIKALFTKEALITTPNKIYHEKLEPEHFIEYNEQEFLNLLKKHFSKVQVETNGVHLYAWVS